MQRYNSFAFIHKALRAMLYDTALCLQNTYFADPVEARIALRKVKDVVHTFEDHASHEDAFYLPAVGRFEPDTVAEFGKEHDQDIALGNSLMHLVRMYSGAEATPDREMVGSALTKAFIEFLVFNLKHMAKEEILLNQCLWKHYTDEEWVEIHGRLLSSLSEDERLVSSKWMFRGLNKIENTGMLEKIRVTAPGFIFNAYVELAGAEMPNSYGEEVLNKLNRELVN